MKPGLPSNKEISKMINQSQLEWERTENLALTIRCQVDALWRKFCLKVLSFRKLQNIKIRRISFSFDAYVAVNFLFQLIFVFPLFVGMVMHANEFETKEKQKLTEIKNKLQHIQIILSKL